MTTIQKYFYAPQSNLITTILDDGWSSEDILENCEALIYSGSSIDDARKIMECINSGSKCRNLKMLSIPIDMIEFLDWKGLRYKLKHLHINEPMRGGIWDAYINNALPDFSKIFLDNLETMRVPCPLVKWKSFDVTKFRSLKWIGVELEEMDRLGQSLEIASKNNNIIGFDIFDPKGRDILRQLRPDLLGLAIYRQTSRSFNFFELSRFMELKYLRLTGGASEINIDDFLNLENLEELEIISYPSIKNARKLFDFKALRYLRIGGIRSKYLSNAEEKELKKIIGFCKFD